MIINIPAKTFLLGEYSALIGGSAIILTTTPCFKLSWNPYKNFIDEKITYPPAKYLWKNSFLHNRGKISWNDPYKNNGGLGSSSAQFLGIYLIKCYLSSTLPSIKHLTKSYFKYIKIINKKQQTLYTSGYDLIAQTQKLCVYFNQKNKTLHNYNWPFKDLSFLLLHSNKKIKTHLHLKNITILKSFNVLSKITEFAKLAFIKKNSSMLIQSINQYQKKLEQFNLITDYTKEYINFFKKKFNILASKGCGALGADVILLIIPNSELKKQINYFRTNNWIILATNHNLNIKKPLIMYN
ncbi:hypothetical protein [Candidatus Legionella polyplacis]|uniref:Mevalonate kinase n=1 Tax=Candidatus Legionella polyplacis TaxID=2005262 RepID=A0ABZ2GX81_9GAMM